MVARGGALPWTVSRVSLGHMGWCLWSTRSQRGWRRNHRRSLASMATKSYSFPFSDWHSPCGTPSSFSASKSLPKYHIHGNECMLSRVATLVLFPNPFWLNSTYATFKSGFKTVSAVGLSTDLTRPSVACHMATKVGEPPRVGFCWCGSTWVVSVQSVSGVNKIIRSR